MNYNLFIRQVTLRHFASICCWKCHRLQLFQLSYPIICSNKFVSTNWDSMPARVLLCHRLSFCSCDKQVSISSTFYKQIFRTNIVSAAFSMCMWLEESCRNDVGTKNLYVKCWWNWRQHTLCHWKFEDCAIYTTEL